MTPEVDTVGCTVHIPGLQLGPGEQVPVGDGILTEISFDDWTALESEFAYAMGQYGRSRPVFLRFSLPVGSTDAPEWLDEIVDAVADVRTRAYRALLLATAWPLPEPALSATYITHGPAVWRLVGPYGREHILYSNARRPIEAEDLQRLRVAHAILAAEGTLAREGALEAAFGALERTTRPEFTPLNRFMHEMIALEQLLLPDKRRQLTETFANRAATLLVSAPDQIPEAVETARLLYRARSTLVHGGDLGHLLERAGLDLDDVLGVGRWALCEVVGRVVVWRATAPKGGSLALDGMRVALDEAVRTPDRWHELSRRWELAA